MNFGHDENLIIIVGDKRISVPECTKCAFPLQYFSKMNFLHSNIAEM